MDKRKLSAIIYFIVLLLIPILSLEDIIPWGIFIIFYYRCYNILDTYDSLKRATKVCLINISIAISLALVFNFIGYNFTNIYLFFMS